MTETRKTADPAGELVRRLCQLKDESGRSLRELERATHASNSALSRYLSGQASPPWAVVVALCREAGRDPRPLRPLWEEACEARKLRAAAQGGKGLRGRATVSAPPGQAGSMAHESMQTQTQTQTKRPPGRNDLPAQTPAFTAREAELAELSRLVKAGRIVAVDGMGGAGKTALAVQAAHQLASEFEDCQIFLDLHGFAPGREPLPATEALRRLLGALEVPDVRIPVGVEERAALWRAELAGRKALIVLDDARDAEQVRPLLPGAGNHAVLITSRRRLVALEAVEPLTVGPLAPEEAAQMFAATLDMRAAGERRRGDDPQAVDELMARCAYHARAIRMTAARLKHRPHWTVHAIDTLPREVVDALNEICESSLAVLGSGHRRVYESMLRRGESPQAADAESIAILEDLVDMHLLEHDGAHGYRPSYAELMRASWRPPTGLRE